MDCALVCLSDLQLSREIFPVSESQCELISIYFMSGEAMNEMYNFFTSQDEISHIHDKNLNFLFIIYKLKGLVFNVARY